jgi:hypothetical protein
MCRYGFRNYKLTYGCFSCQIGFKRRHLSDVQPKLHEELSQKDRMVDGMIADKDFRCPNCGGEMANLGRDLRLPNKHKDEQWQAIKYLYDHKYNIYSCGCSGIGFIPHKVADAIELVEKHREKSDGERLLQKLQGK